MPSVRQVLAGSLGTALAIAGLSVALPTAHADISAKVGALPYSQAWSSASLITANDDWSGVSGVEGFLGQDITTSSAGTDPQTLLAGASAVANDKDVIANSTGSLNTQTAGGVIESELNQSIALQGSGTADAPYVAFHFDLTGKNTAVFAFDAKDLDGSADNAAQQIAVHYRVGNTGNYTNLAAGYIADATEQNLATKVTAVSVTLPAAANNQADVYVRVMTTNASGSDEWVGVDNVNISALNGSGSNPLDVTAPGNKTGEQDLAITPFTMAATGGTSPYTWSATGLPTGVSINNLTGEVSGTPSVTCTCSVSVTATDAASPTPETANESFTFTVNPAPTLTAIDAVQGSGDTSPENGNTVSVQGIVTALYKTGGFDGMYVQTAGTGGMSDATTGKSDAIFVYGTAGAARIPSNVALGDSVRVTGVVSEFNGTTEITAAASNGVVELGSPLAAVTPLQIAYPTTEADREAQEGMLLAPTDTWTVSDVFSANQWGEIGLATGGVPLKQPTEFADPDDTAAIDAIVADNAARAVTLDDGASTNFLQNQTTKAIPLPWLTAANGSVVANPPRVGAPATLQSAVILEYRNFAWKFQPRQQVTGDTTYPGSNVISFADDRTGNLAPQSVGGDITMATFNVQNYFDTTGEAYSAAGPLQDPPQDTFCTYFTDRGPGTSQRIGNNSCGVRLIDDPDTPANEATQNNGGGPRGAATTASLLRQEAKIVASISALDADIIGLEEMENSNKLPGETNRDEALAHLVDLLNTAAGSNKWKYVKSPGEATTASAIAEQDVIRPAFIYQPASVTPVGQSDILFGTNEFANAREPLAQAFKAVGAPNSQQFAVIVNHFKSKGPGAVPATGDNAEGTYTGSFNGDRVRQATRLLTFANAFASARDIEPIFMLGDYNAYSMEEPVQVIEAGGFEALESDTPNEQSYAFDGLMGSLDHVFVNDAAHAMVTGTDIWEINGNEAISFNYSRYNYNVTDFWQPTLPFATSDHNPEVIGVNLPDFTPTTTKQVQIVSTNDFHGRLLPDGGNAAGAAPFSTAVNELRAEHPNTIFAAAGDLIGASTFESFVQDDEPTIDAFNAMGLEVSAAGNHEFDQGYADFVGRVQDRADWEYIAANVNEPEGQPDKLASTWTKTIDGVKVGFVGAVTEDLPTLVNPAGMTGVTVSDIVDSTNAAAADLKADGADIVVLLVHEGSPSTDCSSTAFTDTATVFGNIVENVSSDVNAIVSGHTHLAYNCRFPVADWAGDAVTRRPVVSAGQYGTNLNQLVFNFDTTSGDLLEIDQDIIATAGVGYANDPAVQPIVDDAITFANGIGSQVLGQTDSLAKRAVYNPSSGETENRGGESTLGNLVAEIQRWATQLPETGVEADIAFMNPGGLRKNLVGTLNGGAYDVTYRDAANVQPFANTLVNMDLTGAQIETVLEQQWQRTPTGNVPSRPFLRLGVSDGFTYTYTTEPETVSIPPAAPVVTTRGEVTGMWLNGVAIDPSATYSVTVNSFLSTGGDNFHELAHGDDVVDTGKVDLQAMVDYLSEEAPAGTPLAVDYGQRAVEVEFPVSAPASYAPGDTVAFDVSSWTMSNPSDTKDTAITVKYGNDVLGTATLNNTVGAKPYDTYGTASVSVTLPAGIHKGAQDLTLVGAQTGTSIPVGITVTRPTTDIQIIGTNDFHGRLLPDGLTTAQNCSSVGVGCPSALLAGAVKSLRTSNPNTVFAAAGDLIGASTFESFIQHDKPTIDALNEAGLDVSSVGNHEFDQGYEDLVDRVMAPYNASTNPEGGANWEYLAANVEEPDGRDDLAETWTKDFGSIKVGFVGAVTEELPTLVSPAGIEGLTVTDIVDSVNTAAADLKADGADVVVMLVHEGSSSTNCASADFTNPATVWGNIVANVSPDVNAIISGHTHLAYNCSITVQDWVDDGRAVTQRPVVSSGQYGQNINKLILTVDNGSGEVEAKTQSIVALTEANFTEDAATATIANNAKAQSAVLGAVVLGQIQAPLNRAKNADNTENRGGESTIGNQVAEIQRWATATPETGNAQIAFMNPGGLRQDMTGTVNGGARDLTYQQAAVVQPFANTLVNMDLTGAQIETALEQQWQRDTSGNLPTRPFLRLGVSDGFTYTYTETPVNVPAAPPASGTVATFQGEVTGMWLNGVAIDPSATYSVTVNAFLGSGGDNFREFANGTGKVDTGKVDLAAVVDYMDEFAPVGSPLAIDYSQHAVQVENVAADYAMGSHVTFDVGSWTMSTVDDVKDTQIEVKIDGGSTVVGTATLNNTIGNAKYDSYGTAHVDFVLPGGLTVGDHTLKLVGSSTGTSASVPIVVKRATSTVDGSDANQTYGQAATVEVHVSADVAPTGGVTLREGSTIISSAALVGGTAFPKIPAKKLGIGTHTLTVSYPGDGSVKPGSDTVTVTVSKATASIVRSRTTIEYGDAASVPVRVTAPGLVPGGTVTLSVGGTEIGTGTLSGGSVNVDVAALALPAQAAAYQVDVAYSGDDFVGNASGTVVLVVSKATPTVTGEDVTMTAGSIGHMDVSVTTATGVIPTGKVVLTSGGVTIGSGTLVNGSVNATLLRNKLAASATPYDVTVKYNGDGSVKQGTDTVQVTVNP
ncbi:ExeM/NucH family extracellular endonuclease [Nocardioides humilatus]|uniref:ExeM/NucH family extracellular endonuclease n=1 Tax=Nocardioides humilatus TaxID=2607660 RepID=A0A5B1L8I6_9ACTN|nr:ExeM/NucH family extracellular endonuclease [Nocardioides humilatus]KAA1417003.1 ExeM/NucH family extracellular endonuclease [Nocardioides humilatus]